MIKSMTGFGKATSEFKENKITVEVRSLNSKQLDLNLRLPYRFKEKELELRSDISKQTERGKIDVTVVLDSQQENFPSAINKTLATSYFKQLKSISNEWEQPDANLLSLVLKMPDVLKGEREVVELDLQEWNVVKTTVNEAIRQFNKFRNDEGSTLENEFNSRIKIISSLLSEVATLDSPRIQNIRKRIKNSIDEVVEKERIDSNRFEQEMIFYIEKLDITEEKLRLKTHLDYFVSTMKEASSGRKLGFISQEIGREINTIGSKANDASMQKVVVQMKDELEKIKEQLLNVL